MALILLVVSRKLGRARQTYVLKCEQKIQFGYLLQKEWHDVEADEVDLADENKVKWNQWAALIERGRLRSLVLLKMQSKLTKLRSPGPASIEKIGSLLQKNICKGGLFSCILMAPALTNWH